MLNPISRAPRPKKWIIATAVGFGLISIVGLIWGYEVHLRRSLKETLIGHRWSMQGCMDCTSDFTFRRDGTIEVEDFGVGQTYRGTGTWRLYGRDLIELDYGLRDVGFADSQPDHYNQRWHISKRTREELIVEDMRPIHYKLAK